MMANTTILPILLHLASAIILLFSWRRNSLQKLISVVANVAVLLSAVWLVKDTLENGVTTIQAGNWPAPFGITFVSDALSSVLVLLTAIAGLAVSVYSTAGISEARIKYGYFPILHFLLMGLTGAFLTGDIFNLYVWFEIIIISSFVLMTLGGRRPQIGGGIKYVAMNLVASIIFLTAIAILYGLTGSLNMADLSLKVDKIENRGLVDITAMMFFVAFGIKAAVFPLYFWLPSSYHTPPSAISAIFSGLLTKVGVYAMIRMFTLVFIPDFFTQNLLLIIAVTTLATGAFGAMVKRNLRQIFSYLIICHIGFMIAGIGMFTETALSGTVYYLIHDIIVKTNIFLIAGLIFKIKGTVHMNEMGGLYGKFPRLSFLFALVLFSLVGIPPLSGFWPKLPLLQAGLNQQAYVTLGAIIFASFITLVVVARIWKQAFWKPAEGTAYEKQHNFENVPQLTKISLVAPVIFLAVVTLYIGFGAEDMFRLSKLVATQLLNRGFYTDSLMKIAEP